MILLLLFVVSSFSLWPHHQCLSTTPTPPPVPLKLVPTAPFAAPTVPSTAAMVATYPLDALQGVLIDSAKRNVPPEGAFVPLTPVLNLMNASFDASERLCGEGAERIFAQLFSGALPYRVYVNASSPSVALLGFQARNTSTAADRYQAARLLDAHRGHSFVKPCPVDFCGACAEIIMNFTLEVQGQHLPPLSVLLRVYDFSVKGTTLLWGIEAQYSANQTVRQPIYATTAQLTLADSVGGAAIDSGLFIASAVVRPQGADCILAAAVVKALKPTAPEDRFGQLSRVLRQLMPTVLLGCLVSPRGVVLLLMMFSCADDFAEVLYLASAPGQMDRLASVVDYLDFHASELAVYPFPHLFLPVLVFLVAILLLSGGLAIVKGFYKQGTFLQRWCPPFPALAMRFVSQVNPPVLHAAVTLLAEHVPICANTRPSGYASWAALVALWLLVVNVGCVITAYLVLRELLHQGAFVCLRDPRTSHDEFQGKATKGFVGSFMWSLRQGFSDFGHPTAVWFRRPNLPRPVTMKDRLFAGYSKSLIWFCGRYYPGVRGILGFICVDVFPSIMGMLLALPFCGVARIAAFTLALITVAIHLYVCTRLDTNFGEVLEALCVLGTMAWIVTMHYNTALNDQGSPLPLFMSFIWLPFVGGFVALLTYALYYCRRFYLLLTRTDPWSKVTARQKSLYEPPLDASFRQMYDSFDGDDSFVSDVPQDHPQYKNYRRSFASPKVLPSAGRSNCNQDDESGSDPGSTNVPSAADMASESYVPVNNRETHGAWFIGPADEDVHASTSAELVDSATRLPPRRVRHPGRQPGKLWGGHWVPPDEMNMTRLAALAEMERAAVETTRSSALIPRQYQAGRLGGALRSGGDHVLPPARHTVQDTKNMSESGEIVQDANALFSAVHVAPQEATAELVVSAPSNVNAAASQNVDGPRRGDSKSYSEQTASFFSEVSPPPIVPTYFSISKQHRNTTSHPTVQLPPS